jgi:hypothetical protein
MLKNKKELALALTATFLASLLGLILIEGYYWKSGYTSLVCEICQFHPQLGWETIPGKAVSNGKITYTTNAVGMRSEEVDSSRGHILMVGDSVTFGLGVNNNETVSHYLGKEKKIASLGYQVLNIGVPGYGIGQYYLNLKRHIEKLDIKLIVLTLYTANDLDETRKDNRYGISKPWFSYQDGVLTNLNQNISQYSCLNLHSRLRFAKYLIPLSLIDNCKPRVIERYKASLTTARLIEEIRILGMARNIPTIIVLSPALPAIEEVICKQSQSSDACDKYDLGYLARYKNFYDMMEYYKFPYVHFLKYLANKDKEGTTRSLYVNDGKDIHHYSPQGNHILAQAIAERLEADFDLNDPEPFNLH